MPTSPDTPALLTHHLATTPDPENPDRTRLTLTLTLPTDAAPVHCRKVTLRIPTGPQAHQLATHRDIQTFATHVPEPHPGLPGRSWSITCLPGGPGHTTFTCAPQGHGGSRFASFTDDTSIVTLAIGHLTPNAVRGTADIDITQETAHHPAGPYTPSTIHARVSTNPLDTT
ncbi:hypothetical protein [Streptomyces sp. NPDC059122]|uniref:hypothetical protein n=1 Tax=Streptomyces sp. NPDC059122 TaxID=3346732 RepID=UPI00367F64BB